MVAVNQLIANSTGLDLFLLCGKLCDMKSSDARHETRQRGVQWLVVFDILAACGIFAASALVVFKMTQAEVFPTGFWQSALLTSGIVSFVYLRFTSDVLNETGGDELSQIKP